MSCILSFQCVQVQQLLNTIVSDTEIAEMELKVDSWYRDVCTQNTQSDVALQRPAAVGMAPCIAC